MYTLSKYRVVFLALVIAAGVIYALTPERDIGARMAQLQPAAGAETPVPAPSILAVHKALYDFKLVSVETGVGINGIKGQMYFEQDDTCDAWTTDHRFTTEYQYSEQSPVLNTNHYVAFESKDQKQFSFNSERQENGQMTEQLRGSIDVSVAGAAKAVYSRPDNLKYDLPPDYLLPSAHTMAVIRHARAGDNYFKAVIFDGTDADGPVEIGAFIGKKASEAEIKTIAESNKKIDASLLTPDAWHVRMAIFSLKDSDEMTPSYEMEVIMHDNGVISHALVDYKTFKVEQSLTALEKLPIKKCS